MAEKKKVAYIEHEEIVRAMIKAIGDNPDREGLIGTPNRVVKMWGEVFKGYDKNQIPKVTTFKNGSDGIVTDQMISDTGTFYSHCEHHIIPFFGTYYFAYIPHPKGKILGLSKVARVVDYYSARLQTQERLVRDITNYLWGSLKYEDTEPIAMGIVMEGSHLCKEMRGVKKKGKMRTTELIGAMKTDVATRAEFMDWVNKNGS